MSSIEGIMTKDQWITDCNRHQNDFSDEIKNSSNPEDPIDDIPELLEEAPAETIWMKDGKAIVSTFGETVTSAQLDAFHRSGVSGIDQNRLDRFNRILDSVEPPKDIQPEAILPPKIPTFDVSKSKLAGGISLDVECVPGVYPNTMSKEEIDEAYEKASGQKDSSGEVSEEKPYLHDQESLVMGMQALVVSYTPEEPRQYRVRPDSYIGSGGAPRYMDMSGMSEELRQLFVKGREMADQSLKDLQKTFDREGKETVLRRMEANHFAAHVDFDGDDMECVDCSDNSEEQEN